MDDTMDAVQRLHERLKEQRKEAEKDSKFARGIESESKWFKPLLDPEKANTIQDHPGQPFYPFKSRDEFILHFLVHSHRLRFSITQLQFIWSILEMIAERTMPPLKTIIENAESLPQPNIYKSVPDQRADGNIPYYQISVLDLVRMVVGSPRTSSLLHEKAVEYLTSRCVGGRTVSMHRSDELWTCQEWMTKSSLQCPVIRTYRGDSHEPVEYWLGDVVEIAVTA
jgi:hypothetical protein